MTIDLNIALDSKRQRKPWVVRSVGGKAANGHLSPAAAATAAAASGERSRRLQQQARVFATVESSSNKGRMFINVSSGRREGANILCKS